MGQPRRPVPSGPRSHLPQPRLVRRLPAAGVRGLSGLAVEAGTPAGRLPRPEPRLPAWMRERARRWPKFLGPDPTTRRRDQRHRGAEHRGPVAALKPGDEILTTDHEYAALEKDLGLCRRRTGAKVVMVTVPLPLTRKRSSPTRSCRHDRPHPRPVPQPHHLGHGAALPDRAVVAEARARGIWTVIDGAHVPGHIPLDLDRARGRFLRRQLPQMDDGAQGLGLPACPARLQPHDQPAGHQPRLDRRSQPGGREGPFGNTPFIDSSRCRAPATPRPG
jgi:hypothetical protein